MASQAKQKQKLLFMKNLFEESSDENHAITGIELIDILAGQNIKCERKTVYDDIDTLKESGMDIVTKKKGHSNAYYLDQRLFQDEELLVLVDAVASSRFLTQKKTNELIDKLKKLTSKYKAVTFDREFYIYNRTKKAVNERIYYSINSISQGIQENKDIEFKYYEYSPEKKKQYRRNGETYRVSPYYLVYNDNNYYLICYYHRREQISYFRVDRMDGVTVIDEKRRVLSDEETALAKEQRYAVFEMYPGKAAKVVIKFHNSLMNAVIDRFSVRVSPVKVDDEHFKVEVNVQLSPTFYGWLFKFGDKAELLEPTEAVEEIKSALDKIRDLYK